MTNFDLKVLDNFPGKVVRKDITMMMNSKTEKYILSCEKRHGGVLTKNLIFTVFKE